MGNLGFNLVVKNANWFVLKHAPVLIDMMSELNHVPEEIGYSYENYIESLVAFIECAKDVLGEAEAKGGSLKMMYDGIYRSCESFIEEWRATQQAVEAELLSSQNQSGTADGPQPA